jgi:hypothetical protein
LVLLTTSSNEKKRKERKNEQFMMIAADINPLGHRKKKFQLELGTNP